MRYALIVSSCLCVAAWVNVAAEAQTQKTTQRRGKKSATQQTARAEAPEEKIVWPEETIKGWGRNQAEAEEDTLQKTQEWVLRFLRKRNPGTSWKPSASFIRKNLVTGPAERLPDFDQQMGKGEDAFIAECWGLPVAINRETNAALVRSERDARLHELRAEREGRMVQRMDVLAKFLALVVALLAAVAGYLRLEDWTKGYYTWWLRAAVIGFLSFVALMLSMA